MEALTLTEAKDGCWFTWILDQASKFQCQNHGGDGLVAITQWDANAGSWSLITDYKQSNQDLINKLIDGRQYAVRG